jgi:CRP/FNR family cyclic AMP-dependent transcriptional regulator
MKQLDQLLAEHEFFAGLGSDMSAVLAGCGRNVHFAAGDYLFRTGEAADECYVVRHGRVALELVDTGGHRLVIDTVDPGGIAGLSWLVPPYRWYLDGRAAEPTSAIALDARCVRSKCDADPEVGYVLMQRVARAMYDRMQSARLRMLDIYGGSSAR